MMSRDAAKIATLLLTHHGKHAGDFVRRRIHHFSADPRLAAAAAAWREVGGKLEANAHVYGLGSPSQMLTDYRRNGERPPFIIGQRVRYISPNADQTVKTVTWVSKGATCRADQLISTNGDRLAAVVFVDAEP